MSNLRSGGSSTRSVIQQPMLIFLRNLASRQWCSPELMSKTRVKDWKKRAFSSSGRPNSQLLIKIFLKIARIFSLTFYTTTTTHLTLSSKSYSLKERAVTDPLTQVGSLRTGSSTLRSSRQPSGPIMSLSCGVVISLIRVV